MPHATEKGALHQAWSSRQVFFCHLTALHGHVFYQTYYQHGLWKLAANSRQISLPKAWKLLKPGMRLDMRVPAGRGYGIYCFLVLLEMEKSTRRYYRHNCGQHGSAKLPPVSYFQAVKILGAWLHLDTTFVVTEWTLCLFCACCLQAPTRRQQMATI